MWLFTWQFLIGLFVGCWIGIFIMCLMAMASKAERDMDLIRNQDLDNYLDPDNVI